MNSMIFIIACTFIWTGFIGAISFMESWLKFRAPGLTRPMGLSIGKLIFSALNKVEWAFASLIVISFYTLSGEIPSADQILLFIIIIILIIQTTWLLPALNGKVKAIISGKTISPSNLHRYFIIFKIVITHFFGYQSLKTNNQIVVISDFKK